MENYQSLVVYDILLRHSGVGNNHASVLKLVLLCNEGFVRGTTTVLTAVVMNLFIYIRFNLKYLNFKFRINY